MEYCYLHYAEVTERVLSPQRESAFHYSQLLEFLKCQGCLSFQSRGKQTGGQEGEFYFWMMLLQQRVTFTACGLSKVFLFLTKNTFFISSWVWGDGKFAYLKGVPGRVIINHSVLGMKDCRWWLKLWWLPLQMNFEEKKQFQWRCGLSSYWILWLDEIKDNAWEYKSVLNLLLLKLSYNKEQEFVRCSNYFSTLEMQAPLGKAFLLSIFHFHWVLLLPAQEK